MSGARNIGAGPWRLQGGRLLDAGGVLLATITEGPGLGHEARRILALIEAAPELLHELRLLNVGPGGEQKANTPAGRLIARIPA